MRHAIALLGSAFLVFAVVGIVQGLLESVDSWILYIASAVIGLAGSALYTGFVVTLVQDVRDGRRDFTVGELFSSASGAIPNLIVNSIVKSILVLIGLVLLIIPGLILLTIWAVTSPTIVSERSGAIEAFGRSRELVRGQGWRVFGVIAIAYLIAVGLGVVAAAVGDAVGTLGVLLFPVAAGILTAPITALVAAVLFFDLGGGGAAVRSRA